jgi:AraC-like DNA-binding protein
VGLRPKLLLRILRLQKAVELAESRRATQAHIALGAGYADESHMVREFRALAGVTPRELRAERHVGFVQAGPVATAK